MGESRAAARLDIQGLRAVAVGLVVLDHAGVALVAGGYVGVDVFFVVSGFLITSLLLREAERTGRIDIPAFYARRARRILPAATVTLVATVVAGAALLPLTRAMRVADDAAWSAVFAANVRFAREGTDYFADAAPSPLQHYWSLAVEEQFYVVWPLLVALLVALLARRGARRAALALALLAVAVGSFAWSLRLLDQAPGAAYFSAPARAWELALGALLAVLVDRLSRLHREFRATLAAAGLTAVAGSAVLLGPDRSFPGWAALPAVLGTAAVLAAGVPDATGPARLLTTRPMVWLGDLSYSLYLWHWPVLLLGAPLLDLAPVLGGSLLVVTATVLAVLSHRFVEAPFRGGRWWRPTRRSLALWPLALAATAATVVGVHLQVERATDRLAVAAAAFDPASVPLELRTAPNGRRVHDLIAAALDRAAVGAPIPFPVRNDLTDLDRDRPAYGAACVAGDPEVGHGLCPIGTVGAQRRVVVVGDSHAYMWVPALEVLGARDGFEVVPLVKFGCTPYDLPMLLDLDGPPFPECERQHAWVQEQITALHPDLVLVASRAYPHRLLGGRPDRAAWSEAVAGFVRETEALGPVVRVLGDVSLLAVDPAACLLAVGATMADCTRPVNSHIRSVNRGVRDGARSAGARYVAVNRLVCAAGRCPFVVDDVVTYHDGQHLSATWVRAVADDLGTMPGLADAIGGTDGVSLDSPRPGPRG